jgi:bifunctional DNA-binding transcriptional regulator/antitoxin component of YhaV-PrlF toxin-antitoxin module
MGGRYLVIIPKRFRDIAKIKAGDEIQATVERDIGERIVEIPKDLT